MPFLDPDPESMNLDPKHCLRVILKFIFETENFVILNNNVEI